MITLFSGSTKNFERSGKMTTQLSTMINRYPDETAELNREHAAWVKSLNRKQKVALDHFDRFLDSLITGDHAEQDDHIDQLIERVKELQLSYDHYEALEILANNYVDAAQKLQAKIFHAASLGFSNLDIYDTWHDIQEWLESIRYRRDRIRPDDRIKNHSVQRPKTADQLPLDIQSTWKRSTGYISPEQADLFSRLIQSDPDSDLPDSYHQDYERQFTPSLGLHKSIEISIKPYERPESPSGDVRRVKFLPK